MGKNISLPQGRINCFLILLTNVYFTCSLKVPMAEMPYFHIQFVLFHQLLFFLLLNRNIICHLNFVLSIEQFRLFPSFPEWPVSCPEWRSCGCLFPWHTFNKPTMPVVQSILCTGHWSPKDRGHQDGDNFLDFCYKAKLLKIIFWIPLSNDIPFHTP